MPRTIKASGNRGLEPNVIRGFMKIMNISQMEIARKHGVSAAAVSQVIDRYSTSYAIRSTIADRLGLPFEFIWGSGQKAA